VSKTNDCKRCGNEGMAQHKAIAGGVCFLCGRLPAGEKATPATLATARERAISTLRGFIARASQELEAGTPADWLDDVMIPRDDGCATLQEVVRAAPADVAARATVAFARLGITV
jgi:hypothetical protein